MNSSLKKNKVEQSQHEKVVNFYAWRQEHPNVKHDFAIQKTKKKTYTTMQVLKDFSHLYIGLIIGTFSIYSLILYGDILFFLIILLISSHFILTGIERNL